VQDTSYDSYGRLATQLLGYAANQVQRNIDWDLKTARLAHVGTTLNPGSAATTVADQQYAYDAVGNPTRVTDTVTGQRSCYHYDVLQRLDHAWTSGGDCTDGGAPTLNSGPAPYDVSWVLALDGNRVSQSARTAATA